MNEKLLKCLLYFPTSQFYISILRSRSNLLNESIRKEWEKYSIDKEILIFEGVKKKQRK